MQLIGGLVLHEGDPGKTRAFVDEYHEVAVLADAGLREWARYVRIDALAVALHCVCHTAGFDAAVVRCVNLCGDADTTGAITAQLAGALYGVPTIDPQWLADVRRWAKREIELRAVLLYHLGLRL